MKNLYFIFLLFVSVNLSAQTKGITYQAIIYNPSGESIPGVNNATAPMANKSVCLQFSIIDASSQIEYQEAISTTTDEYGMVNLVIGNGVQSSGYASSFSTITWSVDQKSLKVALDITGQCSDFVDISSQKFESVPYAFSANTADHISGILPIENGGTNATTVLDAKTNLGLENVDNTSDLNKPISNATQAALDIKEDQINKSALTTLGTSDVLYPTQNAVKTYVDAGTNNINAAITNEAAIRAAADATLTTNLATEVNNRINGDNTLTTNLATEVTNRINGDNTLTTNLATEVLNRTNADVVLTNNLATEVTNRTNADLLKEDLSNKSTATILGTSDILYPTQNAVKTYVDVTSTTNTTAINNEAAIRAAADVVLTNNLATEVTNRANADLLKENLANKSTATTLGTSDVLYPSQNAVKTYVDANATTNATAISNEAAIRAAADIVLTNNLATEVTDRTNADLLKENLSNKSTSVNLGLSDVEYPSQKAVKTYVDAASNSTNNALNNEAIIRAAADNNLTINLAAEVSSRTIGDNNLNAAVLTEVTTRTNADLLKENLANKSTSTALGTSDVLYPSQNAVKTYVDASALTINSTISNEASIRAAADLQLNTNLTSEINDREDADLLKEDLSNKSDNLLLDGTSIVKYPTVKTVKDYVDSNATMLATDLTNESLARAAGDNTLTTNLVSEANNRINADLLKENLTNKSTATTLGTSDVLYPTQNAVKSYVDATVSVGNAGINNEAAIRAAADAVLTTNLTTEIANRSNADLAKENLSNKSTATTLGTSNVLYPTQNAVKTYVDASTSAGTTGLSNEAAIRAAADVVLTNDIAAEAAARTAADATLTNDIVAEAAARIAADLLKENTANKSTATTLGTSDVLFPTQNAVKTYVDAQVATINISDADATTKGKIQLAGDLSGTAAAPTVPGLALKAPIVSPNFTGTPTAPTAAAGTNTSQVATTEFVTGAIASATIPDATTSSKGKIQLAGDLSGTASAPVVAVNAITTSKIQDANVTDAKIATVSGSKVTGNITGSAANVTGVVPVANGGTGQTTIAAVKSTLGLSGTNVAIGAASGTTNQGSGAVGLGNGTGQTNQGSQSVAIGYVAGNSNQGANSVAIGSNAAQGGQGTQSVAIGLAANSSANNATALGAYASAGYTNATAIGYQAVTTGSNTIQLGADGVTVPGSTAITNVKTSGTLTAGTVTYPNTHGSTGQVLSTTGSGTLTWVAPSASSLTGTVAIANGGTGATSAANALNNLGAAPLASPTFTGTPTAPTATTGTNTTQLATTAFVTTALSSVSVPDATTTTKGKIQLAGDLSGTAATPVVAANAITTGKILDANVTDAKIATVSGSKVIGNITGSAANVTGTVAIVNGGTGSSTSSGALVNLGAAPLASPSFTGTPTAPTAAANTSTTQVATTAFVSSALASAGLPSQSGNNGKFLTTNGSTASWAASPGVPYTGATGAVNLGAYNLTVNGVKVGVGSGPDPYFLQYSTVVGKDALVSNTYGWQNNAFGFDAMNQNTTGNGNNAFGLSALRSNTTGNNNVAMGQAALNSSVSGNMNTAIGTTAAYHSLGSQVTSIGYESLMGQSTGTGNTALGWRAGFVNYGTNTFSTFLGNNATAQNGITNATAIGNDAFVNTSNTIQLGNSSITNVKTSGTLTAGNVTYPNNHNSVNGQILTTNGSGVASWTNTIAIANGGTGATTSAAALSNLGAAPLVSPNFTGTPTAPTASTGTNNTQVATTAFVNSSISSANSSLAPISSPSFNGTPTAPTAAANTNTTQIATTAFVANALSTGGLPSQSGNNGKFLTTNGSTASWAASSGVPYSGASGAVNLGNYNLTVYGLRIGAGVGDNNALQNNTVFGKDALINNSNGYHNIAVGNTALYNNVGGYANIAIGNESQGLNYWGFRNTSVGQASLYKNTGNNNTAVGFNAGYFINSSGNTAIGSLALDGQGDGGGNTGVGYNAGAVSWDNRTYNSTFLGYNAKSQNGLDNVIVIGYNAYTNEHNTIQLGNTSIVKLKTSGTIWSNGTQLTSDARLKTNIQPLQNSLDIIMKLNPVHYDKKNSIESTDYNKSENGFIAQEIQKVLPFVVKEGNDQDKILSVDYNSVIPVLTKGIQEQQLQIEAQQKQIDEMKMLIEKLLKEKK
jgi:hypothetical protein